jgi:hypothetical protein
MGSESYGGGGLVFFTFTGFNVVNCKDHITSVTAVMVSVLEDNSPYTYLNLRLNTFTAKVDRGRFKHLSSNLPESNLSI